MNPKLNIPPMGEVDVVRMVMTDAINVLERDLTNRGLTVQQTADVLRVSVATIKRWCDQHRLQCIRTIGNHRRITVASIVALTRGTTVPVASKEGVE